MFYKCVHCNYESNREYNIRRHVKNKHESHHPINENQVDNDVSLERLPSSPTKMNVELNESSTSTKFSPTPQVNDKMEGTNPPLGCDDDDNDSKEVSNEEDDAYAEQRERIKMIMSSYDDAELKDSQINSEREDQITAKENPC